MTNTYQPGQRVICNGYPGTVAGLSTGGNVIVRLPGDEVEVDPADELAIRPVESINEHGEKITILGTVFTPKGRADVVLKTWTGTGGRTYYTVHGPCLGSRDRLRRSTAVRDAQTVYSHPSNQAAWCA